MNFFLNADFFSKLPYSDLKGLYMECFMQKIKKNDIII